MNLVAGDIGGTKSWLALLGSGAGNRMEVLFEQRYQSNDFPNVTALLTRFLDDAASPRPPIDGAVLALPGPIRSGCCRLTNLDWTVDGRELQEGLSIPQVTLVNDFQACSAGIETLSSGELIALNNAPAEELGIRVVTGAGTGLGLAWMVWQDEGYRIHATEGGHIDYAPTTPLQMELWRFLQNRFSPVTYENLLSGSGLEAIYQFVVSGDGSDSTGIEAATITARAAAGDARAVEALELFIEVYGSWTGNLALLYRPAGGLYIAGGIAAKTSGWIMSERFINACYNKGKMSNLVKQTPIYLVTNERLGLQGAITIALGRIEN